MTTTFLALNPRDGFFFKDGRGWSTSASLRGYGLPWPFPSTVLGALRTAWGLTQETARGRSFSPNEWLATTKPITLGTVLSLRKPSDGDASWQPSHRMWPVPADALYVDGDRRVRRLDPVPRKLATLGRDDDPARESLYRPDLPALKPAPAPAFWTDRELADWLSGEHVAALPEDERPARALPSRLDVRIAIDPTTGSVVEGALFTTETRETLQRTSDGMHEWALGVEVTFPDGPLDAGAIVSMGSDRRLATTAALSQSMFEPPAKMALRDAPGLRLLLVTPACFSAGWVPEGFDVVRGEYRGHLSNVDGDLVLRAAMVPRATHVSGWDMAHNHPKPTLRLAPPGAAYFFQKVDRGPFKASEMRALWLAALGQHQDEGFGRVVAGPWEIRQ